MNAVILTVGTTVLGAAFGGVAGAVVGAIGGLVAGSILWSWAQAYDNAAMDVKELERRGRSTCKVAYELNNTTMRIRVW